jgi:surface protein
MFYNACSFNQDISNWNTKNVTDMCAMFCGAEKFNQDISCWNVSSVTTMGRMFVNAKVFYQNISCWEIDSVTDIDELCFRSYRSISTKFYLDIRQCCKENNCDFTIYSFKKIINSLFNYHRRKNFLQFLIMSGYIPFNNSCLSNSQHKVFEVNDLNRVIMSFI